MGWKHLHNRWPQTLEEMFLIKKEARRPRLDPPAVRFIGAGTLALARTLSLGRALQGCCRVSAWQGAVSIWCHSDRLNSGLDPVQTLGGGLLACPPHS